MRNNIFAASVMAVLVLCGTAFAGVNISADTFPDEFFRDYVSSNFDLDEDGVLSDDEIASVQSINVRSHQISSLKGIEYFTSLVSLDCRYNYMAELDVPESVVSASVNTQVVYYKIVTRSKDNEAYPYHFDMSSLITASDGISRVSSLRLSDESADISMFLSGDIVYFSGEPYALKYNYFVRSDLPLMRVTVYLYSAPSINEDSLPSGQAGKRYSASISASGRDPMNISASGFPDGLSGYPVLYSYTPSYPNINEDPDVINVNPLYSPGYNNCSRTVFISGIPTVSGSFDITAHVAGTYGEETKTFTLYIASADKVVSVDEEHFPDAVFRGYIITCYDQNQDSILDEAEIAAIEKFPAGFTYSADAAAGVTITNNESLDITDLTGIEYFTNLKTVCIPRRVTRLDLRGNTQLEAVFSGESKLDSLDLSGNTELKILIIPEEPRYYCPPINQRPDHYIHMEYMRLVSWDLTQLNLNEFPHLKRVDISEQNTSADLSNNDDDEYPYSFDFRTIVSEDNLSRIIRDSIQVLDENGGTMAYQFDNWVLRFRTPPHTIKYKYNTGALNITMDVVITIKREYLVLRPEFTFNSKDIPEGKTGTPYTLDITVSGTAPFRWRITSGRLPGGLNLGETTGRISGTPTESGTFTVTISVSNSAYTVYITITIVIRVAVTAPTLSAETLTSGTVSKNYTHKLTATGTGITWSISGNPSWLSINPNTGELYGTPTSSGTFKFTVTVTNSAGSVSQEYTLRIRNSSSSTTTTGPAITTTSITGGTVSITYWFKFIATGTGTITWTLVSGSLPTGLTLNSNGTITGIPTVSGTFTFTVRASDSTGSITRAFTMIIGSGSASNAPLITASSPLPDGTTGTPYSYQLTASGASSFTWVILTGDLPSGLSLSSSGLISGTPTAAGVFRFTLLVQNPYGEYRKEFTITIRAGSGTTSDDTGTGTGTGQDGTRPDITAIYTLKNGYLGVWYSTTLYAEGTRAISWRLTSGTLPAGLTLNANGTITGTPTAAGEYIFTVEAVNSWGNDLAVFRITIYTDEGQCCNNQSSDVSSGLIYEYRRDISSLTEYELSMLPGDIYIIAYVLPRFRVTVAGTYRFTVNLYNTVPSGLTLVWFPFAVNGSGGGTAYFWDSTGRTQIKVSPANRSLIVSVYLDVGTYAPVIAVLRPCESESEDVSSNVGGSGGGGGGCSTVAGMQMLCVLAGMLLIRKR